MQKVIKYQYTNNILNVFYGYHPLPYMLGELPHPGSHSLNILLSCIHSSIITVLSYLMLHSLHANVVDLVNFDPIHKLLALVHK